MHTKLAFCLLFALLSVVSCKSVYINATALDSCTGTSTCYFLDPLLWENSVAPEVNDTVHIINTPNNTVLLFNYTFTLDQLELEGNVTLRFVDKANFTCGLVSLAGSTIVLEDDSTVISNQYTLVRAGASIIVQSTNGYAQDGSTFELDQGSSISVNLGYLGLHSEEARLQGQVTILPNVTFVAAQSAVYFENNTVVFQSEPILYNATFVGANVTFQSGWKRQNFAYLVSSNVTIFNNSQNQQQNFSNFNVDPASTLFVRGVSNFLLNDSFIYGTLYISTSTVTIPTGSFSAPLVLAGQSAFVVPTLILRNVSDAAGENGEAPNVNITTGILHTFGSVALPYGVLNITEYAFFSDYFSTVGSIYVSGDAYAEGIMDVFTNFTLESTPTGSTQYSFELQDADFSATHLSIGTNSIFRINSSAVFSNYTYLRFNSSLHYRDTNYVGDVISEGRIHVDSNLVLNGNFTQGNNGILEFRDIYLQNRTSGLLNIQGEASLDGTISYALAQDYTKNGKIAITAVNATKISGKFKSDPVNVGLANSMKSSVDYSLTQVHLVFEKSERKKKSTWWIWFLVVILVAIVGAAGYYFYRRRRTHQYSAVA